MCCWVKWQIHARPTMLYTTDKLVEPPHVCDVLEAFTMDDKLFVFRQNSSADIVQVSSDIRDRILEIIWKSQWWMNTETPDRLTQLSVGVLVNNKIPSGRMNPAWDIFLLCSYIHNKRLLKHVYHRQTGAMRRGVFYGLVSAAIHNARMPSVILEELRISDVFTFGPRSSFKGQIMRPPCKRWWVVMHV